MCKSVWGTFGSQIVTYSTLSKLTH